MNYVRKLQRELARDPARFSCPGQIKHLAIRHDDWCARWSGLPCNCDPDIEGPFDEIPDGDE